MKTLKEAVSPLSTFFIISGMTFSKERKSSWYLQVLTIAVIVVSFLFLLTIPLGANMILTHILLVAHGEPTNYRYIVIVSQVWGHLLNLYLLYRKKLKLRRLFEEIQLLTYPQMAVNNAHQACDKAITLLSGLNVILGAVSITTMLHCLLQQRTVGVLVALLDFGFFLVMYMWSCILCFVVVLQSFTNDRFHYRVEEIKNSKSQMRRCKLLSRLCHDETHFQKILNELYEIFAPILLVVSLATALTIGFQIPLSLSNDIDILIALFYHKYATPSYFVLPVLLLILKGNADLNRKVSISYIAHFCSCSTVY